MSTSSRSISPRRRIHSRSRSRSRNSRGNGAKYDTIMRDSALDNREQSGYKKYNNDTRDYHRRYTRDSRSRSTSRTRRYRRYDSRSRSRSPSPYSRSHRHRNHYREYSDDGYGYNRRRYNHDRYHSRVSDDKRYRNRKHGTGEPSSALFVGNLPYNFSEHDIRQHFEPFGTISSIYLPYDDRLKHNKGICFINYETLQSSQDAFNNMKSVTLEGRALRLDYDNPRQPPQPPVQYSNEHQN